MIAKIKQRIRRIFIQKKLAEKEIECANIDKTDKVILLEKISKGVYLGKDVVFPMGFNNGFIGDYTYINSAIIYDNVQIGKFCSMGFGICIAPGMHYINKLSTHPIGIRVLHEDWADSFPKRKTTIIGNDVWIGNNATIMQGVTIGDGAVIGAGAIVTKDVPMYGVAVGNPAKILKYRFDEETIGKLNKIRWWDKEIEWIKAHKSIFQLSDRDLVKEIESLFS